MDQSSDNVTLEQALRRANLLTAAAEVSQNITQIMDIDVLLPKTVDIICDAYKFYYSGVFLVDSAGEFAVLSAGRGEPGQIMMDNNHKLAVGGNSMIGACTSLNEARISLDVDTEKVWYPNPVLPETRSEMALPLAIGNRVIGAVTVQSIEAAAFSDEDISSLQAMANQLAIAIDNARQRRMLEDTHAELVRAKMFEAIAAATGDAIHWIGNKAEPISGSIDRVRGDLKLMVAAFADILAQDGVSQQVKELPFAQLIQKEAADLQQSDPSISASVEKLSGMSPNKLEKRLSLASGLEDLQIVDDAAKLITRVKEEMIGPAREQAPRPTMIDDVAKDALVGTNIPTGVVAINTEGALPLVLADPVQLNRVFVNVLNNAYEAMADQANPQITVTLAANSENNAVTAIIADNGSGISTDDLDKIWITFHTTKGIKGHPGLGLPACRLILEQIGGSISATSDGQGAVFTVDVPLYAGREEQPDDQPTGKAKILVIDDNDSWQVFACTALTEAGYQITASGNDYSYKSAGKFDLILIDDILAGRDSQEILKALKADGAIAKTVAVSSNPRVERTKQQMLVGIKNLIPKPYTQAGLIDEVIKALG